MARASSRTVSYDIQSTSTGESRVVIERSYVKSSKVAGRYITASKEYALFDTQGRRYERYRTEWCGALVRTSHSRSSAKLKAFARRASNDCVAYARLYQYCNSGTKPR